MDLTASHPGLKSYGEAKMSNIKVLVADKVEELRYRRVEFVRYETRQNGLDEGERPNSPSSLKNTYSRSLLTGSSDMYPMMIYCYKHDAWTHTDEYLKASLASDHD